MLGQPLYISRNVVFLWAKVQSDFEIFRGLRRSVLVASKFQVVLSRVNDWPKLPPASLIDIKERKKIEGRLHVIEHELLSPRSRTNARNRSLRLALTFAEPDRRFPILVF